MITLEHVYILSGAFLAFYAVLSARDTTNPKRFGNAAFWGLLGLSFLFGSHLSDFANGLVAIALIAVGGLGLMHKGAGATTTPEARRASAESHGNWLFAPVLVAPLVALLGTLFFKNAGLVDPKQATLIFLGLGVVSVPQKPLSMPIALIAMGSPPKRCTISGRPMPAVITGKAAKALPITALSAAMPRL